MPAISRFQRAHFRSWLARGGVQELSGEIIAYLLDLLEASGASREVVQLLRRHADALSIRQDRVHGLVLEHAIPARDLIRAGVQREAVESVVEALSWQVPHAVVAAWKRHVGDPLPTIAVHCPRRRLQVPVSPEVCAEIRRLEEAAGPILFLTDWALSEESEGFRMLTERIQALGLPLAAERSLGQWLPLSAPGQRMIRLALVDPLGMSEADLLEELLWLELEFEGFPAVRALPPDVEGDPCFHLVADELRWWLQYALVLERRAERGFPCDEYAQLGISGDETDHALRAGEALAAANLSFVCRMLGAHPDLPVCPGDPDLPCRPWKRRFLAEVGRYGMATPAAQEAVVRSFLRSFIPFVRRRRRARRLRTRRSG